MKNQLRTILVLGVTLAVAWGIVKWSFEDFYLGQGQVTTQAQARPLPMAAPACGPLPGLGTTSFLDNGTILRENVHYGVLAIRNDQPVTVVAVLGDASMTRRYQAITVGPGSEAKVQMPAGYYGLGIMSGRAWCNLDRGFTDGTKHSINGGVTIKADSTIQTIVGTGAVPGEISVLYRNQYRMEETRDGGLEVRQSVNGYITSGSVNGRPASFMIDTGASQVSLPAWLAEQAGIRCNQYAHYSTSAGSISGCTGTAAEVSFGPFRLQNVEVAVISGAENALLGMDVLRRFNMVWRGDAVRITSMEAGSQAPNGPLTAKAFAPVVPWITPAPVPQFMSPAMQSAKSYDRSLEMVLQFGLPLLAAIVGVAWAKRRQRQQVEPRRQSAKDCYYNPKEFRSERQAPQRNSQTPGTPQSRLLLACGGDKARVARLMEYEKRKAPSITDAEAARRALERIERDRH